MSLMAARSRNETRSCTIAEDFDTTIEEDHDSEAEAKESDYDISTAFSFQEPGNLGERTNI